VDCVLKSFQGGFESREPPLQAFDTRVEPPTSVDWKRRNRIRPRAFPPIARRSGAAITISLLNLFRATDATGRGSRPEVRSGPGPRATHNQPGTPASLLLRDHDGAGFAGAGVSAPALASTVLLLGHGDHDTSRAL
jgi:hypothetical protein